MGFNLDDYEPVAERIDRFYTDHSGGRIVTEIVARGEKDWVVKASVYRREKDTEPSATGFAQEVVGSSNVNRTSALENCETSAIGRALANLGYDAKGQRASREEMEKVERHSGGGEAHVAAQTPVETQAAAQSVSPPPDKSQKGQGGASQQGPTVGGEAAVTTVPPVSAENQDWTPVLEEYGAAGVLQIAQEVAKELGHKAPFTKRALADLPPEVFAQVMARLGEKERVA